MNRWGYFFLQQLVEMGRVLYVEDMMQSKATGITLWKEEADNGSQIIMGIYQPWGWTDQHIRALSKVFL